MARVSLLSDPSSLANQLGIETWRRALRLWRLPCRIVAAEDVGALDASRDVLVVDEAPGLNEAAAAGIERFVSQGGALILAGEAAPGLLRLAGVTAEPRAPTNRYRCLRTATACPLLDRFAPDEILFFTCSAYNALSPGRDFAVAAREATAIALSQEITLVDPQAEVWADSAPSDEPSLVMRQFPAGGRVVYSPLPLGSLTRLKTPTVVGVSQVPYRVENHGVLLLMAGLVRALAPMVELCLWPRGADAVVALSGDVHEYFHYPQHRARHEYEYLERMARLFRARGLDGKYTFSTTARVAEQHPDAVRAVAHFDIVPHTFDDISLAGLGREEQAADIHRCLEAFAAVIPDTDTYRLGWRTHTYGSDAVTREALAEAGYLWISDLGASWYGEWDFKRWPVRHTAYVAYPQRARGVDDQPLPLWEMPECAPSDFALYESGRRHPDADWAVLYSPEEAERVWLDRFNLARRREELFILNWHPFLTLSEPGRAQIAESVLDAMRHTPGVAFMTITEAARWWDAREKVEVDQRETEDGLLVTVANRSGQPLQGLALRAPAGAQASRRDGGSLEAVPRDDATLVILGLAPGATAEIAFA